jgi:hypothetical protein
MIQRRLAGEGFVKAGVMPACSKWYWMPVAGGMGGVHGIPDFIGCDHGLFWYIEAKSEDGHPTEHQINRMAEIERAGGVGMVVRNDEDMTAFITRLNKYRDRLLRELA